MSMALEQEPTAQAGWDLAQGDEIVPGLTAMRLLGGGSAYEAYLAFDDLLYTPVVVKLVRPDQVEDPSTLRGLEREVDMLGRLNHPAIVRGFRADLGGARPYVVLENLDGPRLSSLIRRHGALPLQQLLPLGIELAAAAHYLRQLEVVHLDIKPGNIIMGAPAKLIDLSVARSSADAAELVTPIGTDPYMAPEQCMPGRPLAPCSASDVWGIGATLFHALTGRRPFGRGRDDVAATDAERWPQLVSAPAAMPPRVPEDVAATVLACLSPHPQLRPTPAELADAFEGPMAALPKPRLGGWKNSLR
uniref:Serine/threonine protein kinase n=1 Tax=uncultured Nocardioidaceae bacterium TaxID=253824 RepID=A0A6J4MHU5_9ACTN|nr:MAG: Serine/threonine protein kinase [uncultured Nocardioidaceae bacterium]